MAQEGAVPQVGQDVFVQLHFKSQRAGDGLLGQIVVGGPEAPRGNQQVAAREGGVHRLRQTLGVVAHHGVVEDVEAQQGQLLGEEGGVGVSDVAQQDFGSHTQDFGGFAHGEKTSFLQKHSAKKSGEKGKRRGKKGQSWP